MLIKHLNLGTYFKVPNSGLRLYLDRTRKGNAEDYRTPLFSKRPRQLILAQWNHKLYNLMRSKLPGLGDFEQELLAKCGPISIQKPGDERKSDLENYYTDILHEAERFTEADILAMAKKWHARRNILARSLEHTVEHMKKSTNSGAPYFQRRREVVEQTLEWLHSNTDINDKVWMFHQFNQAALIGGRGQEGGFEPDDVKQRIVFMFTFSINILELQIYQPIIEYLQSMDCAPAYISNDRVDEEITALFDSKGANDLVICTDFTRFDQHFNSSMQEGAKKVLTLMLANNSFNKVGLDNVFPVKYNIPMVTPTGVYYGPHGMGSGSGGTNTDESASHGCLQFHAAHEAHQKLNEHSMTHGDDGILTFPGISGEFIERVYSRFGQEANKDKFHISVTDAVFLRRGHSTDYRVNGIMVGVYSTCRALNKLLSQERFFDANKWNKEMVVLRSLSIIENCKWHPYFHKFIDFVLQGDKYKLGLAIPGFFKNIKSWVKYAHENFSGMFSYNVESQDSLRGISNGSVVKYLLSKGGEKYGESNKC